MTASFMLRLVLVGFALGLPVFRQLGALQAAEEKPSRWEKAISAFETEDRKNPPPKNAILFVGSSSIRLWDLPKSFPDLRVINRGFGGSEISDSIEFAERIIFKHEPRVVVLYAGDNDIAKGKSAAQVVKDFHRFEQLVHARLPKTRILFIAIKPSTKRWSLYPAIKEANATIQTDCAKQSHLTYVDIATPMLGDDGKPKPELFVKDGLHLNSAGYAVWNKVVLESLR
ncbi:MAG: SGNH/GDSL hydrolase family protein [Planctomycetota bacterium]|nr:SGNH/GDSL hydrolase family protein [Planctomycetota bacterium]